MENQQETPTIDEEAEQHRIDQKFIDAGWLPSWDVVDRLFEEDPDQSSSNRRHAGSEVRRSLCSSKTPRSCRFDDGDKIRAGRVRAD